MSNVGFIVEEINNERDAVFQCPIYGTETKSPENIYRFDSLSLVKGSSVYPQNDILYPQFVGVIICNCIHKIEKYGYKSNEIQQSEEELLSYSTKKYEKKCYIKRFVDTTQPHHKIDGGGFCA